MKIFMSILLCGLLFQGVAKADWISLSVGDGIVQDAYYSGSGYVYVWSGGANYYVSHTQTDPEARNCADLLLYSYYGNRNLVIYAYAKQEFAGGSSDGRVLYTNRLFYCHL